MQTPINQGGVCTNPQRAASNRSNTGNKSSPVRSHWCICFQWPHYMQRCIAVVQLRMHRVGDLGVIPAPLAGHFSGKDPPVMPFPPVPVSASCCSSCAQVGRERQPHQEMVTSVYLFFFLHPSFKANLIEEPTRPPNRSLFAVTASSPHPTPIPPTLWRLYSA